MNAVATLPRPSIFARSLAFVRGLFGGGVKPRAPLGDAGRRIGYSDRGKRPTPQDRNPATFTPQGWSDELDKTRRDPKIAAGIGVRVETFLSAEIRAVPADGSLLAKAAAALVNETMGWDGCAGVLARGWPQIFAELCCIADLKGASLGEECWEVIAGRLVPVDIEQRHIANIQSWDFDKRGRLIGVNMRAAELFREYRLPLGAEAGNGGGVHFTFSIDGDVEGRLSAVLGPTIDWVALKVHMTAKAWDGVSRWALPVIMSILRTELAQKMGKSLDDPLVIQAVAEAGEAATAFLSGEDAALHSSDMVGFEAFGGVLDLEQWVKLSNEVDQQGLTALGVPTLTMGVSATNGSHSAADAINDLLLRSVAGRLTRFLHQLRAQTITRLVRFNLGEEAPIPILVHEGIDVDGLAAHMGNIPHLVAARIIDPDAPEDRRKIRRTLGLDPSTPAPKVAPAGLPALGMPGAPGPGRGNDFALDGTAA